VIYPSALDLTVLQDSTFEQDLIVMEAVKAATVNDATNTITCQCHGFAVGDRVAFGALGGDLPCGLTGGVAYFVIATGLTGSAFRVSTTSGGSEVDFTVVSPAATYVAGRAINLTNYTFDADVRLDYGLAPIASLTCTKLDAPSGTLRLSLTATQTLALSDGIYIWDLKFKTSQKSFYYAKGTVTIEPTVSRD
jgi:hypothetical protein